MTDRQELPFFLRAVRAALRRLNVYLNRRYESSAAAARPLPEPDHCDDLKPAVDQLRKLELGDPDARAYFEKHLTRLARSLSLVPRPRKNGRILELGCYMQITPFLKKWCEYTEVRGAYYGPKGCTAPKRVLVDGEPFQLQVDLFDAERDCFPYCDGYFESVVVSELIEHLLVDPMHLLLECNRVLEDGGRLLVTTPNAGSLTTVARALQGYINPQVFSKYSRPRAGHDPEIQHVREYTAFELSQALESAGFEIETLFTEPIAEFAMNLSMWAFLEEHGYNTSLRGEQTYCVAVKRSRLPVIRFPEFLYSD